MASLNRRVAAWLAAGALAAGAGGMLGDHLAGKAAEGRVRELKKRLDFSVERNRMLIEQVKREHPSYWELLSNLNQNKSVERRLAQNVERERDAERRALLRNLLVGLQQRIREGEQLVREYLTAHPAMAESVKEAELYRFVAQGGKKRLQAARKRVPPLRSRGTIIGGVGGALLVAAAAAARNRRKGARPREPKAGKRGRRG